jgi:hypothetical protein
MSRVDRRGGAVVDEQLADQLLAKAAAEGMELLGLTGRGIARVYVGSIGPLPLPSGASYRSGSVKPERCSIVMSHSPASSNAFSV